jgi:NAD+ diphosphatase
MPFVPALHPPGDSTDGSWCWVNGSNVMVAPEPPEGAATPAMYLGALDGEHWWAQEVLPGELEADAPFEPLFAIAMRLGPDGFLAAGRAVQLVDWDRTHRYCGRCATATEPSSGERSRRCPACGLVAFPRLAPAAIVLVEDDDGRALLAHGRTFASPMWSALAGFVEPGETVEDAVRREVKEEVGIDVDRIEYVASQPWPFPHSLMLGFTARHAGGDITIDESEIVDAQWFARDALPTIPPPLSIARRLIDDWLARA